MKVYVLNDTGDSRHPGCQLIHGVIKRYCALVDIRIMGWVSFKERNLEQYYFAFEDADLLLVNGEGSIHDNNRNELIRIAGSFPSVLMNAVYQNNITLPEKYKFLKVFVRESFSRKNFGSGAEVVPDLVFASSDVKKTQKYPSRKLGVTDSVNIAKEGDITFSGSPERVIERLTDCRTICTGRFHGIVLCLMLGVPFSAYGSNTFKNAGLMWDLGMWAHFRQDRHKALKVVPEKIPNTALEYLETARGRIRKMFDKIANLVT